MPATDGACSVAGTFAIGAGNRALDGFANATNPVNDLVLDSVQRANVRVAHADTFLTPERFRYEPAGGVPAGNYRIEVCDFDDGAPGPGAGTPWADPRTYEGTLIGDASAAPPPYLARWKVFPANPPLAHARRLSRGTIPDTDTRETWCWYAAPGCDPAPGRLPTGRTRAVGSRPQD